MQANTKRVDINFNPSAKQSEAWVYLFDKETDFIGYGGSAFSGKSYLECYWLTVMCIGFPGTGWFLGRSTLTTLKDTVLKTLFKVFAECNIIDGRDYKLNSQTNILTFTNGSEIFLLDLAFAPSDPLFTWLGGYEFTGGAIDESAEVVPGAIDILASRIGRRMNTKYNIRAKILETFNPTKNHVYTRYYSPWKSGFLKKEYKFVKALPQDNPSPEVQEWLERMLKGSDETTKQRLVYGNFDYDDDPARLIDNIKAMDIFTNTHVSEGRRCITADIARLGGDRIVIIEWSGMRGKVIAFEKKKLTVSTTAIEATRVRTGCGKSDVLVDADGMGSGVEDFGGFKGFINNSRPMADPKKPLDASGKPVVENFDMLKSQCGFRMAEVINSNGLYLEAEEWMKPLILEELAQVKQKLLNSDMKKGLMPKDKVKEALGRSPDFWDAILMRAWFELKPKFVLTATAV
jgi:hypothetical protein